jgi:Fic family protein
MKAFKDFILRIVEPLFSSDLTNIIIDLEHLRKKELKGSTHPKIFFELKNIFHILESIESARIEGNNTTISEYVDTKVFKDNDNEKNEKIKEIQNMEKAMGFIEDTLELGDKITRGLILELHKKTIAELDREGDRTPGYFRTGNVSITGASHMPPDAVHIDAYIEELIHFINAKVDSKYDLLKIAIAHHRFAWIHPFNNGNGRVVRLLTYAMLIREGFNVTAGRGYYRLLNPTAVFCNNRELYYEMLSKADKGDDDGILVWSQYVLSGLLNEVNKIDRLTDYAYLSQNILIPAINYCRERENITEQEAKILRLTVKNEQLKSSDLDSVLPKKNPVARSRIISKLLEGGLISPIQKGKRKYIITFSNNYLLRGVINALRTEGFISIHD